MRTSNVKYQVNSNAIAARFDVESKAGAGIYQSDEEPAVLTLYDNGTICECNGAAARLLECVPNKLTWQHISNFLPRLAETPLMQGGSINPTLRFLSRVGYGFEVIGMSGARFACMLFFNEIEGFGRRNLRLIFRPVAQEYAMA